MPATGGPEFDFYDHTLTTMSRVLGQARAEMLLADVMKRTQISLTTADELYTVARELEQLAGFEAAVGAMLRVDAVMRGAVVA